MKTLEDTKITAVKYPPLNFRLSLSSTCFSVSTLLLHSRAQQAFMGLSGPSGSCPSPLQCGQPRAPLQQDSDLASPFLPHPEEPSRDEEPLRPLPCKSPQRHGRWAMAPTAPQLCRAGSPRCPTQGCHSTLIPPEMCSHPKPRSVRKHQGFPHPELLCCCWGRCHFVPMLQPGGFRSHLGEGCPRASCHGWLGVFFPQKKVCQ